ncbi:MAG TPA: ABC transporter ATP-binding protein [Actinomycetota bacterium]|nr:ABC transporter ATP-binding protein [Actinomycetota bacterium]
MEQLSKRYGGLAAVDGLTFSVAEGETLGIAGPNGAGKTTLFDVISGHAAASSGRVRFMGREIQRMPAHAICALGIARTFQVTVAFPELTVLGNILVGAYFGRGRRRIGLRFDRASIDRAIEAASFVGLGDRLDVRAGPLSLFDKKRLMIASSLATEPRLLLLDEPVGGLTPAETDSILELVRRVRDGGVTVIVIEHVMRALMSISDRVVIMNHGRLLFDGTPRDVVRDAEVIRVYLGTLPAEETPAGPGEEVAGA